MKILIVEDEPVIAQNLFEIIVSFGFEYVKIAHTKNEALQKLDFCSFDLALLDIRLEGKFEGIEIAKHISENTKIPFIFITAFSDK